MSHTLLVHRCSGLPDINKAIEPQTYGELIDVPFIRIDPCSVQFGTEVIAPPGAEIETPLAPSVLKIKTINLK